MKAGSLCVAQRLSVPGTKPGKKSYTSGGRVSGRKGAAPAFASFATCTCLQRAEKGVFAPPRLFGSLQFQRSASGTVLQPSPRAERVHLSGRAYHFAGVRALLSGRACAGALTISQSHVLCWRVHLGVRHSCQKNA